MNKLALSALMIGGLFQATGCIITTDNGDEVGSFDVAWSTDGACPDGAAAEIISLDVTTQERFTDIYNCSDGAGVTAGLPLGLYDVWVEITSADGNSLFAQSNAVQGSLTRDGDLLPINVPAFPINDGYFGLTWSLLDGGGAALTCADVFSGGVDIVATSASTSEALVDVFNCEDGTGVSAKYPIDTYTIVVDVLDENDAALGSSVAREESITFGNELVDLGNFDFTF